MFIQAKFIINVVLITNYIHEYISYLDHSASVKYRRYSPLWFSRELEAERTLFRAFVCRDAAATGRGARLEPPRGRGSDGLSQPGPRLAPAALAGARVDC